MKLKRPQYLMAAIILLAMGIQCLYVDSYILTPQASATLSSQLDIPPALVDNSTTNGNANDSTDMPENTDLDDGSSFRSETTPLATKKNVSFSGRYTVILPQWLTWSLLGASLVCFLRTIPWLSPRQD